MNTQTQGFDMLGFVSKMCHDIAGAADKYDTTTTGEDDE